MRSEPEDHDTFGREPLPGRTEEKAAVTARGVIRIGENEYRLHNGVLLEYEQAEEVFSKTQRPRY